MFIAVLLACGTTPVRAQSRVFLEGVALMSADEHMADGSWGSGAGMRAGMRMSRRLSGRVEWETARWTGREDDLSASPEGFFFNSSERAWQSLTRDVGRSATYALLVGVHYGPFRRVEVALLGGAAVVQGRRVQSGTLERRARDGTVTDRHAYEHPDSEHSLAPTAGADVSLRVTRHVLVVPEVRFHLAEFPVGTIVRRGVALRWQF
jgi:hypothetical protein